VWVLKGVSEGRRGAAARARRRSQGLQGALALPAFSQRGTHTARSDTVGSVGPPTATDIPGVCNEVEKPLLTTAAAREPNMSKKLVFLSLSLLKKFKF
jgi:hypothetical protein